VSEAKTDDAPTPRELIARAFTMARRSLRFWPVFVGTLLVAVAAFLLVPQIMPPVYVSQTTLIYRELIQTTNLLGRDAPVETQRQRGARMREMLLSRSNIESIIKDFSLYPDTVASRGVIEAVEEFKRHSECRVGEDTFAIKFETDDAEVAHAVTERLGKSLVEEAAKYRTEQADSTLGFLQAQQEKTKKELDDKEQKLAQFLAQHPEFAQDVMAPGGVGPAGASIRAQERRAAGGEPHVAALERQRQRILNRLASADGAPAPAAPQTDPAITATIDAARRDVERAKAHLADVQGRYTDKHPDVVAAKRRVDAANAALAAAQDAANGTTSVGGTTAPPTEADKEKLNQQLGTVQDNLARARKGTSDQADTGSWIVDLETQWAGLNRDVTEVRERYQQIQRHFFQASIIAKVEASGGAAQMVVVDPAYKPERPDRMGTRRVGAAAAFVTLLLGAFLALVLAYLDDRVYDDRDLSQLDLGGLAHAVPSPGKGARRV
jgi:uncharacterized protein involved in exopolysaccharide biosynthesis